MTDERVAFAWKSRMFFAANGDAYRLAHAGHIGRVEKRIMGAIVACRTTALGGHVEACDDCGVARVAYNSYVDGPDWQGFFPML